MTEQTLTDRGCGNLNNKNPIPTPVHINSHARLSFHGACEEYMGIGDDEGDAYGAAISGAIPFFMIKMFA